MHHDFEKSNNPKQLALRTYKEQLLLKILALQLKKWQSYIFSKKTTTLRPLIVDIFINHKYARWFFQFQIYTFINKATKIAIFCNTLLISSISPEKQAEIIFCSVLILSSHNWFATSLLSRHNAKYMINFRIITVTVSKRRAQTILTIFKTVVSWIIHVSQVVNTLMWSWFVAFV